MKPYMIILIILTLFNTNIYINYRSYCGGFEDGYCEGYKYSKGQNSMCPLAPVCPTPKVGQDEYKDGYNRGFALGCKKGNQ